MLRLTFLFSKFSSDIAASILSPPTNLDGLASDAFRAMLDFFIKNSNSQFSGLTIDPIISRNNFYGNYVIYLFITKPIKRIVAKLF